MAPLKKSLVVVESPAKAKTINKFLGKNFKVMASVGHLRDLPKSKLGVDIENNFEPEYVTIKGKGTTLKDLKKAGKDADQIFLAPDPDREGEAIAWHIAEALSTKENQGKIHRVLFNEITKNAILKAIDNPLKIDTNKFDAQQARRILDRLVGYQVSPILWDKVRRGLSAGRVQSVAVRVICEREREIQAFNAVEYWSVTAELFTKEEKRIVKAKLTKHLGKKIELSTKDETDSVLNDIKDKDYVISDIVKKERKQYPTPPFITSRLQQEASRKLGYSAKKTMMFAQQLYEGVQIGSEGQMGLITYMRTDSTRVSPEAINAARIHIEEKYGKPYLPEKPIFYKSKKGAQDAHEAIRPTYLKYTPDYVKEYLSRDQHRLYTLIWNRFISSQMTPAVLDQTKALFDCGDYTFQANGSIVKFQGFTIIYVEGKDVEEEREGILPDLEVGQQLDLGEIIPQQHFTQPPPRYTEATLVKTLEENGIGRPSTYAAIISTIQDREYVTKDGRTLAPTEMGFIVTDLLVESFPDIVNVDFTATMETKLDEVEEGTLDRVKLLSDFYGPFKKELDKAKVEMRSLKTETTATDIECSKCGKMMIIKWGRNGKFLACPAYPECKNTMDFEEKEDGKIVPIEKEEISYGDCPNCGKMMILKTGRFGRFIACTGYPECKTTKAYTMGIACPEDDCDGEITEKKTRKGRLFYGCSNYPKCDFATWKDPLKEAPQKREKNEDGTVKKASAKKKKPAAKKKKATAKKKKAVAKKKAAPTKKKTAPKKETE